MFKLHLVMQLQGQTVATFSKTRLQNIFKLCFKTKASYICKTYSRVLKTQLLLFFFLFFFLAKSQLPTQNHNFLLNHNSKPNSPSHKQILQLNQEHHKQMLKDFLPHKITSSQQKIAKRFLSQKIYKKDFLHSKLPSNSHSQQATTTLPNYP